ncbi:MAG TPA: dihydrofolate reductase [Burkholderiales bacterium]
MPSTSPARATPRVSLIVAMASNRCIGRDNRMPWHLPADLQHFKRTTLGKPVLMGRKTYESIVATLGKPLPGRANIIISRNLEYQPRGADKAPPGAVLLADSPAAALAAVRDAGLSADEIFVIGGAEIYRAMLPAAQRLVVTEIRHEFAGDAFFPFIDPKIWAEASREAQPRSGEPEVDFDFVEYRRMEQDMAQENTQ